MSDEEYEYDYGSDAEYDYGSDQDNGDEVADDLVEIENSFFEAEDIRSENQSRAIELFEKVVRLEESRGDQVKWRFKALQHLVVLYFLTRNSPLMIERYRSMLLLISSVTRNECTDAINVVLDTISAATDVDVLSQMYEITLEALKTANNERLWFNTNLKLARVYLEGSKVAEVERILLLLKQTCQLPDGSDDISKGSALLEVYCIEIQLCSHTHNAARMRNIYPKTMNISAAVADPRVLGTIREEGGKMMMSEGCWHEAYEEFNEAFRNYQEAGNPRAKSCLKYVVIASMLSPSVDINPFAAREAKVYSDDREIMALSDLRGCLEVNDIVKFERILNNKQNRISAEPFIMKYLQPLRKRMREQVLVSLTRPFSKVSFKHLAGELNLTVAEVEFLLTGLIIDGQITGAIDQVDQSVQLESTQASSLSSRKIAGLEAWADHFC
jgi:COP9 signalosome complex subunit 2